MRITLILFTLITCLTILTFSKGTSHAMEPIVLDESFRRLPLGLHIEILEDPGATLNFRDVTSFPNTTRFRKSKTPSPNFGFTASAYWVRFSLKSQLSVNKTYFIELDYPLMDKISLFSDDSKGNLQERTYGYSLPFPQRDVQHRNFVLSVMLERGQVKTFYLRFKNDDRMEIPLTLWEPRAFFEKDHREQYILGIYYGILLVMILYNFFLFVSIRDRTYLFYVLYIIIFFLFQLTQNGFAYELIYPGMLSNHYIPVLNVLLIMSIIQFAQLFMNTSNISQGAHRILTALKISFPLTLIIWPFAGYGMTIIVHNILLISIGIFLLSMGFIGALKGYRSARFFIIAWLLFGLGAITYMLKITGILPNNYFTTYSVQVGSALEVILLSLGLGDKINTFRKEKETAQEELLHVQRSYSKSLELTVYQRTQELEIERNKLRQRNEIMEHEIVLARKIQEQLIPSESPVPFIASRYKPMEQVGGDFYDFITFEGSEHIGIFLSDVSGHGVHAAFITSMIKTIILQAGEKKDDPAAFLHDLNDVLYQNTGGNFITVFYGIYNPSDRTIVYANAGHCPPYIISNDGIVELAGYKSIPIAVMDNQSMEELGKEFRNNTTTLSPGSTLLIYTDGITECRPIDKPDLYFEFEGMYEVFMNIHHLPCTNFVDRLFAELTSFRGSSSFEDDVCMVCLDVN